MKAKTITTLVLIVISAITKAQNSKDTHNIQLAILLDVSSSMDPLIAQTRSQLWRIADYLNTGSKKGKKATVEFALITYGGYLEQYKPDVGFTYINSYFSTDIDSIGSQLIDLEISGGEEYCYAAIDRALNDLNWSTKKGDLRLIVIAGNESFNQGHVDPTSIHRKAKRKNVFVNTIYSSKVLDDADTWKNAAAKMDGKCFVLSLTDSAQIQKTFLDHRLVEFNNKRNQTYLPYGANGLGKFKRMVRQDESAELQGMQNLRDRIFFKTSDAYKNPSWDLVDAFQADTAILDKIKIADMPKSIVNLGPSDRLFYLKTKARLRAGYNDAIRTRYAFIGKYVNMKNKTIDVMIIELANEKGHKKGFSFATIK